MENIPQEKKRCKSGTKNCTALARAGVRYQYDYSLSRNGEKRGRSLL